MGCHVRKALACAGLLLSPLALAGEKEDSPSRDVPGNRSFVEKNREFVQFGGKTLTLADFKKSCNYVNHANFRFIDRHSGIVFEARVATGLKGMRKLTLLRQGEELPLVFTFDATHLLPKSKKLVRNDLTILAYGWVLDDPIPDTPSRNVVGRPPRPEEPVVRQFYLAGAEPSNPEALAKKRLDVGSQFLGELDVVRAVDHWDVAVAVTNRSRQTIHDVEVEVVVTDGSDQGGNPLARMVVEMGTLASRESAVRQVSVPNPSRGRPFVAKLYHKTAKGVVIPD